LADAPSRAEKIKKPVCGLISRASFWQTINSMDHPTEGFERIMVTGSFLATKHLAHQRDTGSQGEKKVADFVHAPTPKINYFSTYSIPSHLPFSTLTFM
jgi:hypothetical protein